MSVRAGEARQNHLDDGEHALLALRERVGDTEQPLEQVHGCFARDALGCLAHHRRGPLKPVPALAREGGRNVHDEPRAAIDIGVAHANGLQQHAHSGHGEPAHLAAQEARAGRDAAVVGAPAYPARD